MNISNAFEWVKAWIKTWDFMAIFYSLIASVVCFVILKWGGVLRKIHQKYREKKAFRRYRLSLTEECGLLTVVGKRKGFKIKDVFVPLDTAPSNLMHISYREEEIISKAKSYVLVGGPGAGKSTTVKQMIYQELYGYFNPFDEFYKKTNCPIFLRLRDYVGFNSLEQFITHKFKTVGFDQPTNKMHDLFRSERILCVLDGLDEVRPQLLKKVICDINSFYHKYFLNQNRLIVTCRKEAYRRIPLDIPIIIEVRPLTDQQIKRFAKKWPLGYPSNKTAETFWHDLAATPRILELARSPLLLVGGLMQYTESNLGIPEERFEYLERVARWLTIEWATAQGHPPDEYRQIYSRLLSRLGYHLHSEQRSDIQRAEAEKLITMWLPSVGRDDIAPNELIDAISTRTGILVSDDRNFLVFSQFGLQEYFASLEFCTRVNVDEIVNLKPKEWWREVILLAIAQQREPTSLLEALFQQVPLIAAAATAECPTPSTKIQQKAADVCLLNIDSGNKEAASVLIPLLRKIQGEAEKILTSNLEKRLSHKKDIASMVAIALATAGTESATSILARHPEIWDQCLKEAGYLSSSFENMLVNWIQKGTDSESRKASDLIAVRLSMDRLHQLLDLLPILDPLRAEYLSKLLINHSGKLFNDSYLNMKMPLSIAARCCSYIKNKHEYLSERIKYFLSRNKSLDDRPRIFSGDVCKEVGMIATCLFLNDNEKNQVSEIEVFHTLFYGLIWTERYKQFIVCSIGALILTLVFAPFLWETKAILVLVVGTTIFASISKNEVTSYPRSYWYSISSSYDGWIMINLGLITSAILGSAVFFRENSPSMAHFLTVCTACVLIIVGLLIPNSQNIFSRHDLCKKEPPNYCYSGFYIFLFVVFLLFSNMMLVIFLDKLLIDQYFCMAATLVFMLWLAYSAHKLKSYYKILKQAEKRAITFVEQLVEENN